MKRLITWMFAFWFSAAALAAVNINTASKDELDVLPGIGPAKAQAIVDYRTKIGPFKSIEDLKKVNGIGDATFEKLKGDISVSGRSTPVGAAAKSAAPAPAAKAAPVDPKAKAQADLEAKKKAEADAAAKAKADKEAKARAETEARTKGKASAAPASAPPAATAAPAK